MRSFEVEWLKWDGTLSTETIYIYTLSITQIVINAGQNMSY